MVTGYRFFRMYQSLNLHFTSNYDLFKYNKKTKNFSEEVYEKRNDRDKFEGLARLVYNEKAAFHFCLANFVHNEHGWLYASTSDANDIYLAWRGYVEAFEYNIKREFEVLKKAMSEHKMSFTDMTVKTKKGNPPPLLQLLVHGKVKPEFVVALHNHTPFLEKWHDMYKDIDPFLEKVTFMLLKYAPIAKIVIKDLRGKK